MLLPALNKARGRAQLSRCTANLSQIGLTVSLYASDYDDYIMPCRPGAVVWWTMLVAPYISFHRSGGSDLLRCPTEKRKDNCNANYGYNCSTFTYASTQTGENTYRKHFSIKRASERPLVIDRYKATNNYPWFDMWVLNDLALNDPLPYLLRHNNRVNTLFLGGNVALSDARRWNSNQIRLEKDTF